MLDNVVKHKDIVRQSKRQSRWKKPQEKEFGEISADNAKRYNCDKDGKIYPNSLFMTQHMLVCTSKKLLGNKNQNWPIEMAKQTNDHDA